MEKYFKTFFLLGILSGASGCSRSDIEATMTRAETFFTQLFMNENSITSEISCTSLNRIDATNYMLATLPDGGKVTEYKFLVKNRQYRVDIFYNQSAYDTVITDDLNIRTRLPFVFNGFSHNNDDIYFEDNFSSLHFFQHDFDFDDIDELVIGFEGKLTCHDNNDLTFSIFKLTGDGFKPIDFRTPSDNIRINLGVSAASNLTGWGVSQVDVKGNFINLDRRLRGFYFKYFVQSGEIVADINI